MSYNDDRWAGRPVPLIGAAGTSAEVNVTINLNVHMWGGADEASTSALAEMLVGEVRRAVIEEKEKPMAAEPEPSRRGWFRQ